MDWLGDEWGLVFCRADGWPLSGPVVTHHFQAMLARAGLPRLPFHRLRHSAASIMIALGVPLRTVMEILGHSDIGTTANIYGHLTGELTRDATGRVGQAIWGVG
jgi:integrase